MPVVRRDADPRQHRVPVRHLPIAVVAADVRQRYEERFGNPPSDTRGWFHDDDWRRTSFVLGMARPGTNVLDHVLGPRIGGLRRVPWPDGPLGRPPSTVRAAFLT